MKAKSKQQDYRELQQSLSQYQYFKFRFQWRKQMPNCRLRQIRTTDITTIQNNVKKVNGCHEWKGNMEDTQPVYFGHRVRRLLYTRLVSDTRRKIGLTCKNPLCINLSHMYVGDKVGTSIAAYDGVVPEDVRGESNGHHKLTEAQVLEIRDRYTNTKTSYRKLAREFEVDQSCIGLIIRRKNWFWLDGENDNGQT